MSKHVMNEPGSGWILGLIGQAPTPGRACPATVARGSVGSTFVA